MRIPLHKIYRAFPELDRFSDDECERYVHQARTVAYSRRFWRHALEGLAMVGGFAVVLVLQVVIYTVITALPGNPPRWFEPVAMFTFVTLLVAVPSLGSLMVRDRWLRRAIADRLANARCPHCEYSLLGLPVDDGSVQCPECGETIELAAYGLMPADLLSDRKDGSE